MKKFFILFLFLTLLFTHLYQKVKIVILAYQIHNKKVQLDNLVEEKSELVYNFYKEMNLVNIRRRLNEEGLKFSYPKEYISIASLERKKPEGKGQKSILAKIFRFTSQVEAQP